MAYQKNSKSKVAAIFVFDFCATVSIGLTPTQNSTLSTTTMPLERKPEYYKYVIKFMSYRDDEDYDKDHEFTPEELNAIQPEEIEKLMTFMVYGVSEPGPDDNHTLGRSLFLSVLQEGSILLHAQQAHCLEFDLQDREPNKTYSSE
jgi:hypothetical protein